MKKFLFVMLVTFGVVLTSCIKNEEPDGLREVRYAKAELLKAEAQYKLAEIALINVDVKMGEALVANQLIDNQILETLLQKRLLEVEIKALEVEKAKAQNEADIKAIEAQILANEVLIIKAQFELDKTIAYNEIAMQNLEIEIKKAEAEYQAALRILAFEAQYLTEKEQKIINDLEKQLKDLRKHIGWSYDEITKLEREIYDDSKKIDVDYKVTMIEFKKNLLENQILLTENTVIKSLDKLIEQATEENIFGEIEDTKTLIEEQEVILEDLNKEKSALNVNTEADWQNLYTEQAKLLELNAELVVLKEELKNAGDMDGDVSIKMADNAQIQALFAYLNRANKTWVKGETIVSEIDPSTGYPKYADNLAGFTEASYVEASKFLNQMAIDFTSYNMQNPEYLEWLKYYNEIFQEDFEKQYSGFKADQKAFVDARDAWVTASNAYKVGYTSDLQVTTGTAYDKFVENSGKEITKISAALAKLNKAIADTTAKLNALKVEAYGDDGEGGLKKISDDKAKLVTEKLAEEGTKKAVKDWTDALAEAGKSETPAIKDAADLINDLLEDLAAATTESAINAIRGLIRAQAVTALIVTQWDAYVTVLNTISGLENDAAIALKNLNDKLKEITTKEGQLADAIAARNKALEPIKTLFEEFIPVFNKFMADRFALDGFGAATYEKKDVEKFAALKFEPYKDDKGKAFPGYVDDMTGYNTTMGQILGINRLVAKPADLDDFKAKGGSIQKKWYDASLKLYGIPFALTDFANDTHYKNSIKFGWLAWGSVDNNDIQYNEDAEDLVFLHNSADLNGFINSNFQKGVRTFTTSTDMKIVLPRMNSSSPNDLSAFFNSSWYKILLADYLKDLFETGFPAFFEAADEMVANLNAAKATVDKALEEVIADKTELDDAIAAKTEEIADQTELIKGLTDAMAPSKLELDKLTLKISTVKDYIKQLDGYITSLEDILKDKYNATTQEVALLSLNAAKQGYMQTIVSLQAQITQHDKDIAAILAGEYDEQRKIEDKQKLLDGAKKILEEKLAKFDEITKKLEDALAAFTKEQE